MTPESISISLSGASNKLQPVFPHDPRFDLTITLNNQTVFKLRKAYLKCWCKYFEREVSHTTQHLEVKKDFDPTRFSNVLSTVYGHAHKIPLQELPEYMRIVSFLGIQNLKEAIRNHLIGCSEKFDLLELLSLAVDTGDKELKLYALQVLQRKSMDILNVRRSDVLKMPQEVFVVLAQFLSKNIKSQGVTWTVFNDLLRQYAASKKNQELYLSFRDDYINIDSLSSQEYSTIFVGDVKQFLESKPGKHDLRKQMSQMVQNKSAFFDNGIKQQFKTTLDIQVKNRDKLDCILSRIAKFEGKSRASNDLLAKADIQIANLLTELNRINSRQPECISETILASKCRPFIDKEDLETQQTLDIRIEESQTQELYKSVLNMQQKISSEDLLTFSKKPHTLEQSQFQILSKFLGFDAFSKGHLRLIFTSQSRLSKQEFRKAIHNKQQLVFLIYVFEDNKHLGAYTSAKIDTNLLSNQDHQSFMFSITNDCKLRTMDPAKSIKFDQTHLISFSEDLQIADNVLEEMSECNWPCTYEGRQVENPAQWLVGNLRFQVSEFEVYEIIRIQIKMEMDL